MSDIRVNVSIENLSPANGTTLTPLWVGFHNGEFDLYDQGEPVTAGLERLAEDGNTNLLSQEFIDSGLGQLDGVVGTGPIAPGSIANRSFMLDADADNAQFFSYASMILPSNDFFVANGSETAHPLFDEGGAFVGDEFFIVGDRVLDAGTEVNDERFESTAFFGQSAPDTGTTEGVVRSATGFIPVENGGNILADERFADADFTADGYEVARVEVTDAGDGRVTVAITNLAPENGTRLTPLWVGFHDGTFDTYNRGEAVTAGLESLAEDGGTDGISAEFAAAAAGGIDGTVGSAPIEPQARVEATFDLSDFANAQYFSYASMVLPSNDFFVSNGNPLAHRLFDESGAFVGASFTIAGDRVLDAGTEINDEAPANTAFFGQAAPNTGKTEGVVNLADGFIPNGRILSAEQFAAADFTDGHYQIARVKISELGTASGEANNLVSIQGSGTSLKLDLASATAQNVNEIIAVFTEDETGALNGLMPGDEGYLDAVIENAQTVFSTLQGGEFADFSPTRTLSVAEGQFIQFAIVQNGSLDGLRNGSKGTVLLATAEGNADSRSALRINPTDNGTLQLSFRAPDGGGSNAFTDLVVNADFGFAMSPLGTTLQNSSGLEVLDLRDAIAPVSAEFTIYREANFSNQVGFYQIENEQGQVLAQDDLTLISPGDAGYQEAALARRLDDVLLGGRNNSVVSSSAQLSASQLLAPFLISDGTIGELLDTDLGNNPDVFFAFLGANSDRAEHVRLLGDNTFGFEDIVGGGDQDFDDIVVSARLF